jgi:hypothetical protein
MGLWARCDMGTGRATCKLCKKLITKEQIQIFISGYKTSGAIHSTPADCINDNPIKLNRNMLLQKTEEKETKTNWLGDINGN